jgi:hypothetical protein
MTNTEPSAANRVNDRLVRAVMQGQRGTGRDAHQPFPFFQELAYMNKLLALLTAGLLSAGVFAQTPAAPAEPAAPAAAAAAAPAAAAPADAHKAKAHKTKATKAHKSGHKKVAKKHGKKPTA